MHSQQLILSDFTNDFISYLVTQLKQDPRVRLSNSAVTVSIEDDNVLLEGLVNNISEKRAAVATLNNVLPKFGEWYVIDHLHVRPTRPRDNLELAQSVGEMLCHEPAFQNYSLLTKVHGRMEINRDNGARSHIIIASVKDGQICLSGQVESHTHKRLAEVLMWWVDGCEFVDNQLEIWPPEKETDQGMSDAIYCVLEKDPLVHRQQLSVNADHGTVTVEGCVASKVEKMLAIHNIWCVPGVTDVIDKIIVQV